MEYAPKGIANLGNTCYLNACIQILSRIEPLVQQIQNGKLDHPNKMEVIMWKNWKDIVAIMQNAISKEAKQELLHPSGFVTAIEQVSKHKKLTFFQNHEQEDVSEFLLFFMDCLHECQTREIDVQISGQSKGEVDDMAILVYKKIKDTFERQFSEIANMFYGVQVSRIQSVQTQQTESQTPEVYYLLDMPVLSRRCTLYECFDKYVEKETLDGDNKWYNEKTESYEEVYKSMVFWSFPDVLVICLKRIQYDGRKNTELVEYPITLDLRSYVAGYRQSTYMYDLMGVCLHEGNKDFGHYMAFIQKDAHWFFCNDDQVQKVDNEAHLIHPHAHCLFYVKKNNAL